MSGTKLLVSQYKPLMLRLPEPMLVEVRARAEQARRSVNSQLLYMIEDWLRATEAQRTPPPTSSRPEERQALSVPY